MPRKMKSAAPVALVCQLVLVVGPKPPLAAVPELPPVDLVVALVLDFGLDEVLRPIPNHGPSPVPNADVADSDAAFADVAVVRD